MKGKLHTLQRNWDELGRRDPMWSILSLPEKKDNRWQTDEFFRTGEQEIKQLIQSLESLSCNPPRAKALDFGCGAGRLTQPLASYFDEVFGVDIAPSMIDFANRHNRHPEQCRFIVNESADLKMFSDDEFGLIYSNIVLQHIPPAYTRNYLREFLRILSPRGILVFQLPSGGRVFDDSGMLNLRGLGIRILPRFFLDLASRLNGPGRGPRMEMYWTPRSKVIRFLERNGARVLHVAADNSVENKWTSYRYYVAKS